MKKLTKLQLAWIILGCVAYIAYLTYVAISIFSPSSGRDSSQQLLTMTILMLAPTASLILCAIWWFVKAKNNIIGNIIFALILIATLIWAGPVIYLTLYAAASHRLFIEAIVISLLILAWFIVTCVTNHKRRTPVCNQ